MCNRDVTICGRQAMRHPKIDWKFDPIAVALLAFEIYHLFH
jgi:hypothetical protein